MSQLSTHLGNVLSVVSDRKLAVANASNAILDGYYTADIVSATDCYPGGI